MKKSLIAAAFLTVSGLLLFAGTMNICDWDYARLNTVELRTREYTPENFEKISINAETADIEIMPSADDSCKVVCKEREKTPYSVEVSDGTLQIEMLDNRSWYDCVGLSFSSPKITLLLPEDVFALKIDGTTGDIDIADTPAFSEMEIEMSTGDIFLHGTKCEGLLKISVTTGDVVFENADAERIDITATTGSIKGTLLSAKSFDVQTKTGTVEIPGESGGPCKIRTTTGNIKIAIAE